MQEFLSSNCQFFLTVSPERAVTNLRARDLAQAMDSARVSALYRRAFHGALTKGIEQWRRSFKERLHKGYAQTIELAGKPLVEEKSHYQRIKIFDTVANGRVHDARRHRPDHRRATKAPMPKC